MQFCAAYSYPKQRPLKRHISASRCVVEVATGFFLSDEKGPAGKSSKPQKVDAGVTYMALSCDTDAVWNGGYRYGFNGQVKDEEIAGKGNHLAFDARAYDPRLGRWLSVDPLANKYPNLNSYNFAGNNPILFIDYDGRDFGLKIDHSNHTIIIVANVYTTSQSTYKQALQGAAQWNERVEKIDGYTISFKVTVNEPSKGTFTTNQLNDKSNRVKAASRDATLDPIGNVYAGTDGAFSEKVSGEKFTGGTTFDQSYISMNEHQETERDYRDYSLGDLGEESDLVAHELGHIFGLDDKDGDKDGKDDPYYGGNGGIMQYKGLNLSPISVKDIGTILRYSKDYLDGKPSTSDPKVIIIEEKGQTKP